MKHTSESLHFVLLRRVPGPSSLRKHRKPGRNVSRAAGYGVPGDGPSGQNAGHPHRFRIPHDASILRKPDVAGHHCSECVCSRRSGQTAVFHFLIKLEDRLAYVRNVASAVKPCGHVIISTFGPEGPVKCSGTDVMRHDARSLHAEFGPRFHLVESLMESHVTPFGTEQQFLWPREIRRPSNSLQRRVRRCRPAPSGASAPGGWHRSRPANWPL